MNVKEIKSIAEKVSDNHSILSNLKGDFECLELITWKGLDTARWVVSDNVLGNVKQALIKEIEEENVQLTLELKVLTSQL